MPRARPAHPVTPSRLTAARAVALGFVGGAGAGTAAALPTAGTAALGAVLLAAGALIAAPHWSARSRGAAAMTKRRALLALVLLACAVGVLRGGASLPPRAVPGAERSGVLRGTVLTSSRARVDADGAPERMVVLDMDGSRRALVRVSAGQDGRLPDAEPGDWLEVRGRIALPRAPTNPGERDRRGALRRNGMTCFVRANGPAALRSTPGRHDSVEARARRLGARLRRVALARLSAACGGASPTSDLLSCLLVGERSRVDEPTLQAFRRAGAAHLLAVSGLHVVLLVGALGGLLARGADRFVPGRAGRAAALVLSLTALVLYALTCRLATPVVRASVFVAVALVARAAGRRTTTVDHLAVAAAVVVAAAPGQVLSPGFQLSFAAVAGLCWLTPRFREALFSEWDLLARFPEAVPRWRLRGMRILAAGVSATLAASTATAPVAAAVFGEIHPAAPLTNLVAVPVVGVLLPAAACATALGDAAAWLSAPALEAGTWLLRLAVGAVASLPGATLGGAGATPVGVGTATALLVAGALIRPWRRRHLLLPAFAWLVLLPSGAVHSPAGDGPGALVLDVGHGLAVLVRGGSGGDVLFDAGSRMPGAAERVLVPALRAVGVRRLTALAVSHEDSDHCGAAPEVLAAFPVGVLLVPGGFGGTPAGRRVLESARAERVPVRALTRGDRIHFGDVRLVVLHPASGRPGPAENAGSLVVHVTAGDPRAPPSGRLTALLPGDLESAALVALAADPTVPAARLLVLPHHGRGAAAPQVALARRVGARILVASTSAADPSAVPGSVSTAASGALWIGPRGDARKARPP